MDRPQQVVFDGIDFEVKVRRAGLDNAEIGALIHLLCMAAVDPDACITGDETILAKMSNMGDKWEGSPLRKSLDLWFDRLPDGRLQARELLDDRQRRRAWSEKSRLGGRRSGQVRRAKRTTVSAANHASEPNTNHASTLVQPDRSMVQNGSPAGAAADLPEPKPIGETHLPPEEAREAPAAPAQAVPQPEKVPDFTGNAANPATPDSCPADLVQALGTLWALLCSAPVNPLICAFLGFLFSSKKEEKPGEEHFLGREEGAGSGGGAKLAESADGSADVADPSAGDAISEPRKAAPRRPGGDRRSRTNPEWLAASERICDLYVLEVRSEWRRTCRADRVVYDWLAGGVYTEEMLTRAVRNYASRCNQMNRIPTARKACEHFFSPTDRVFCAWIDVDPLQFPDPPKEKTLEERVAESFKRAEERDKKMGVYEDPSKKRQTKQEWIEQQRREVQAYQAAKQAKLQEEAVT